MKKIFTTLFAAAALVFGVQAQENLKIHFADGTTATHKVAAIDSITFDDVEEPEKEPLFSSIEVTNIKSSSAVISVNVTDTTVTYTHLITAASVLEKGTPEQIAAANLSNAISNYGEDKGNTTYTWNGLPAETSILYLAIAFDGSEIIEVGYKVFTTAKAPVASQNVITVSAEKDGNVSFTTTNDDPYYWNVYPSYFLSVYTLEQLFDADVASSIEYYGEADFVEFLSSGDESYSFSSFASVYMPEPDDYVIFAAGIDATTFERTTAVSSVTVTVTAEDLAGGAARVQAKVADAVKKQQFKSLQAVKTVSVLKK